MGIVSLVFGILAIVIGAIGFFAGPFSIVGLGLGILGIVLGAIGRAKKRDCATGGLVCSIIGVVFTHIPAIIWFIALANVATK